MLTRMPTHDNMLSSNSRGLGRNTERVRLRCFVPAGPLCGPQNAPLTSGVCAGLQVGWGFGAGINPI